MIKLVPPPHLLQGCQTSKAIKSSNVKQQGGANRRRSQGIQSLVDYAGSTGDLTGFQTLTICLNLFSFGSTARLLVFLVGQ